MKVVNTESEIIPHGSHDFFSWEQLSFMQAQECSRLIQRLKAAYDRVIIVLVLREPASLYASHKNQSIKHLSASLPVGAAFERSLYGTTPKIKEIPADCWYLDRRHHQDKWSGCDELRLVCFEDIAGAEYTKNFISKAAAAEFFVDLDQTRIGVHAAPINASIDHARFVLGSHVFEKHRFGVIDDQKLALLMGELLNPEVTVSSPLYSKDFNDDLVLNEACLSVLDFSLDLLAEIHRLRQPTRKRSFISQGAHALRKARRRLRSLSARNLQCRILRGLEKLTGVAGFLVKAMDSCLAAGDTEGAFMYAEMLMASHPGLWIGYARSAKCLVLLGRYEEAQSRIQQALRMMPNHPYFLKAAIDIYRISGLPEQALGYSQLLISHDPADWNGYARATQNRLLLGRFDEQEQAKLPCLPSPPASSPHWEQFWISLQPQSDPVVRSLQQLWISSYAVARESRACLGSEEFQQWHPFQYWSQGEPPEDVRLVTRQWNRLFESLGLPTIMLFNKQTARSYIEENCPELLVSFSSAFHYAVEADVFRIAFAQANHCLWLDSDLYPTKHTASLLSGLLAAPRTTLFFRWFKTWITNAFFMTPASSPFFRLLLEQTKGCDFASLPHTKETIQNTFGPRRYNRALRQLVACEADLASDDNTVGSSCSTGELAFVCEESFARMSPPFPLKYKSTTDSWQRSFARSPLRVSPSL